MSGPVLTTARLELRLPAVGDLVDLHDLTLAEETRRYLGGFTPSVPNSFGRLLRTAGSWSLYGYGIFMVRLKGQPKIIATCGVFHTNRGFGAEKGLDDVPEAGWIIHQSYWGQGIAVEAMTAALDWFEATHGKRRIAAMIEEGHDASIAVARRLGFVAYDRHNADDGAHLLLFERT